MLKSIYTNMVFKIFICTGLLVSILAKYYYFADDLVNSAISLIFDITLIVFAVFMVMNRKTIDKNIDEMALYANARANRILDEVSYLFLIVLAGIIISPHDLLSKIQLEAKDISVVIMGALLLRAVLNVVLFRHFDKG